MKMAFLNRMLGAFQAQLQNLTAVSQILNRNMDIAEASAMIQTINVEVLDQVKRVIQGRTQRIRAIEDVAKCYNLPRPSRDEFTLQYCKVGAGSDRASVMPSRSIKLELLRLAIMSNGLHKDIESQLTCDNLKALVVNGIFNFHVVDFSKFSNRMGEKNYIDLYGQVSVKTGLMSIKRFVCESEDIDYQILDLYDKELTFNYDDMFYDYFERAFNGAYPECDLDMVNLLWDYENFEPENLAMKEHPWPSRLITVKYGVPDEAGLYPKTEKYLMEVYEKQWRLFRISDHWPQRDFVGKHEFLPFMVARFAQVHAPEASDFIVQYDGEVSNVAIMTGEQNVESDPLAEVLPESGD